MTDLGHLEANSQLTTGDQLTWDLVGWEILEAFRLSNPVLWLHNARELAETPQKCFKMI